MACKDSLQQKEPYNNVKSVTADILSLELNKQQDNIFVLQGTKEHVPNSHYVNVNQKFQSIKIIVPPIIFKAHN